MRHMLKIIGWQAGCFTTLHQNLASVCPLVRILVYLGSVDRLEDLLGASETPQLASTEYYAL